MFISIVQIYMVLHIIVIVQYNNMCSRMIVKKNADDSFNTESVEKVFLFYLFRFAYLRILISWVKMGYFS